MSSSTLNGEIQEALAERSTAGTIDRIKSALCNAIQAMDRNVEIHVTDYFNHTFVPDLVLSWPKAPEKPEREVFTRLDCRPAVLADDLLTVGSNQPILIGLDNATLNTDHPNDFGAVGQQSVATSTLVTDPDAVEDLLDSSTPSRDFGSVLPAALLKGGQGVVTEPQAQVLAEASHGIFAAATISHRPADITTNAARISPYLSNVHGDRFFTFTRALWEATGGDPASFPISTDLSGLDDDALRYLLEEGPEESDQFWRAVGERVSYDRLVSLQVASSRNVHHFIRTNADRLTVRVAHVDHRVTIGEAMAARTGWHVVDRALMHISPAFSTYFARRREDIPVTIEPSDGISLKDLSSRVEDMVVESATLASGDGTEVTIDAPVDANVVHSDALQLFAMSPSTRIVKIVLNADGRRLECRFDERLAYGHTSTLFELPILLVHALALLAPGISPTQLDDLSDLVSPAAQRSIRSNATLTLFDWRE